MIPRIDDLDPNVLEPLRELRPDICCVAFGNPKQEQFIARFGDRLGIAVMIGVGGSLDFIVGEKRRAPEWMQRTGFEWLHRAATEPRRLAGRVPRGTLSSSCPADRPDFGGGAVDAVAAQHGSRPSMRSP